MRTLAFSPAAESEMYKASDWYEDELSGLGERFLSDVEATAARVVSNPRQFPVIYRHVRRAMLEHFPYALMFLVQEDESVSVISCFHSSRDPLRWQERI